MLALQGYILPESGGCKEFCCTSINKDAGLLYWTIENSLIPASEAWK